MSKRCVFRCVLSGILILLFGCGDEVGDETGTALVRFLLEESLTPRWEALGEQLIIHECDNLDGPCVTEPRVCNATCDCSLIANQIEGSPFPIPLERESKLERVDTGESTIKRYIAQLMNSRCLSIANGITDPLLLSRGDILPLRIPLTSTSIIRLPVNLETIDESNCQIVNEPLSPIDKLEICIPNEIQKEDEIEVTIFESYNAPEINLLSQAGVFVEIQLDPEPDLISPPITLKFPFDQERVGQLDMDASGSLKLFRFNSSAGQWAPLPNQRINNDDMVPSKNFIITELNTLDRAFSLGLFVVSGPRRDPLGPLPPVADDQFIETFVKTEIAIIPTGSDVNRVGMDEERTEEPIEFILDGARPQNGNVEKFAGALIYAPSQNFNGIDTFQYRFRDTSNLSSNLATVTVYVKPLQSHVESICNEESCQPVSLKTIDINGDGRTDLLATANEKSNNLSLLRVFNDDLVFSFTIPIGGSPEGESPIFLTVLDFLDDTTDDFLATVNLLDSFTIVSPQTFDLQRTFNIQQLFNDLGGERAPLGPIALATKKITGKETEALLAIAHQTTLDVLILKIEIPDGDNSPLPTVTPLRLTSPVAANGFLNSMMIADVTGDNAQDIITIAQVDEAGQISVLAGQSGILFAETFIDTAVEGKPTSISVADIFADENGALDLAVAYQASDRVEVFKSQGNGQFISVQNLFVGSSPSALIVTDVTTDNIPDLVTANSGINNISILRGRSDGNFEAALNFGVSGGPADIVVTHINNDKFVDIVTANSTTDDISALIWNQDEGTYPAAQGIVVGESPSSVVVKDMNKDGNKDLVVANENSENVFIIYMSGLNEDKFSEALSLNVNNTPNAIAVEDLDQDGTMDIITANKESNRISVFMGKDDRTFQRVQVLSVSDVNMSPANPTALFVADVIGNNALDIVTANSLSQNLSILEGDGNGFFEVRATHDLRGNTPSEILVQHVNDDPFIDIVTANQESHTVSVLLGREGKTFGEAQVFAIGEDGDIDPAPAALALADVIGSEDIDIITANSASNDISILQGHGDGTFTFQKRIPVDLAPLSVRVNDVNMDGSWDIITANSNSNNVSVLLGQPNKEFASQQRFRVGFRPVALQIADVTGEGFLDLITANKDSNNVSVLIGGGDGQFKFAPLAE